MSTKSVQIAAIASLLVAPAVAQNAPVEINQAELLQGAPKATLTPLEVVDLGQDPTPFGVNVRSLAVRDTRAGDNALTPELEARLQKFQGQSLSFKLLSEIQAEITNHYRDIGQPLVSVTVPPQEISSGDVKFEVVSFVLAQKEVSGNKRTPSDYLLDQVRAKPGDVINSDRLVEDVNWLNLNPFRQVQGVFEPGSEFGTTNIILEVSENRPWAGFVGIANTGNPLTGEERIFTGFNTSALPFNDHQLAYQFTASPSMLERGRFFNAENDESGYAAHSLTYFAPLTFGNGQRVKLTFQIYRTSSFSITPGALVFDTLSETTGASVEAAVPLPKVGRRFTLFPELVATLDYKKRDEDQFAPGFPTSFAETEVTQYSIGVRANTVGQFFGKNASGGLSATILRGDTKQSTVADSQNTYFRFDANQRVQINDGLSIAAEISGQISSGTLSALDEFGVGGVGTVRGYESNEVAGSSGVAASLEVIGAPISLADGNVPISVSPYGFFDIGYVEGDAALATASETISSVGFGGRFSVGAGATATLEAARALSDGVSTLSGDTTIHFNLTARF